jgi:hypothetical protein
MPFQYLALFLPGKITEYFAEIFSEPDEQRLAAVFRYPYYVILAIPTAVA